MGVDAVQRTLIVNPKPDSQDNARREQRHDDPAHGHANQPDREPDKAADSKPLSNAYGETIGKTINIAV